MAVQGQCDQGGEAPIHVFHLLFALSQVGGTPLIAPHGGKFVGIRNGIDPDLWDPASNQWLPLPYGESDISDI